MSQLMKERSKKQGMAPGALVHIGAKRPEATSVEVIQYDPDRFQAHKVDLLDAAVGIPLAAVTWINVEGLSQTDVLNQIGSRFPIHPLVLEDILATDQRPKVDDHKEYLYVVLKMISLDEKTDSIRSEQVSIVVGCNYLISFQEGLDGDVFDQVRTRLKNENSRLRHSGPDFLLHALLDVIVDGYFLVLERLAERIEELEDELIEDPTRETMHTIYRLKREMLFLHKSVWPLRAVVSSLQNWDTEIIGPSTGIYFRDLYDHTIQVVDTLETLRDMLTGMIDIYLSSISNRLNEIMKTMTIPATIFMPLSFIVGWYGMNFKAMPEYDWQYGYPCLLTVMAIIAGGMVIYFRKKRWL